MSDGKFFMFTSSYVNTAFNQSAFRIGKCYMIITYITRTFLCLGNHSVTYYELPSIFGHDTFLLDVNAVAAAIKVSIKAIGSPARAERTSESTRLSVRFGARGHMEVKMFSTSMA